MKSLSIDIETCSGADLSKCGVYKYVEAPDFEIRSRCCGPTAMKPIIIRKIKEDYR